MTSFIKYYFVLVISISHSFVVAQSSSKPPNSNLILGNSLTYMPLGQYEDPIWGHTIMNYEYSWTVALGLELHPIYRTSLQNTFFAFIVPDSALRTANITGITHQINPAYKTNFRMYGELGMHLGRYCSCSPELRRLDQLHFYLSLGGGGNIWLTPKLDLKLAITHYLMFHAPTDHTGHTRYFIGLDYYFRKRNKKAL